MTRFINHLIIAVVALSSVVTSSENGSIRRRRTTDSTTKHDFTITCETDHIVMVEDQVPSTIDRSCTISTFGTFSDSILLSCSSSFPGVDCNVSPSSVTISENPSYVDVTVKIETTDTLIATGETDEIVVTATYDTDEREESIPVVVLSNTDQIKPRNDDVNTESMTDFFLLGGQSNMQGHTTSRQSLTKNETYFLDIKQVLEDGGDPAMMESKLLNIIESGQNKVSESGVRANLAKETMNLYNQGLLSDLDTPLSFGSCSYVIPQDNGNIIDKSRGTQQTVWDSDCGHSFGHELTFSRTLEMQMNQTTSFETVKNSHGGSEIYRDWYPNHGRYWDKLQSSIRSRKGSGNWKGFLWHQGTQEAWTEEDTSLTYLGNLTGLIKEVRKEMLDASEPGTWQCAEEIPVVVVQIGYWPQNQRAQNVRDAQAHYCDEDPRAEMAITYDLARFYHFDATSFLVGGNRIAVAYQKALESNFTCPEPTLSSSPTDSPFWSTTDTESPTGSPTGSPTYYPTYQVTEDNSPPSIWCSFFGFGC